MFEMVSVNSSNVDAIGYDEENKELKVNFVKGSSYVYMNVPKEVYEDFVESTSKGRFFNRNISYAYEFYKE